MGEEERAIRKEEKERKERDNRHKSSGKRPETEEERAIRKEKERKEKEARYQKEGKRPETEEERAIRKEKERKAKAGEGKRPETEEERRIRKEKERSRGKETEEERRIRKEKEKREKKEREKIKEEVKDEPMDSQESQDDSQDDIKVEVKEEMDNFIDDEEEDAPISKKSKSRKRQSYKEEPASDDGDEDFQAEPDSEEEEKPKPKKSKKRKKSESEEEEDFKPAKKSKKPPPKKIKQEPPSKSKNKAKIKQEVPSPTKKGGKAKKEEEKVEVWKWWEEDEKKKDDGSKWYFLEHRGPLFAPAYEPLPETVRFFYDGKKMHLSEDTEEVASFYGRMLDHDYTTKEAFNKNFFGCWRKVMNEKEKEKIRDLSKCDFPEMNSYWKSYSQARKDRSKEEKKAEKLKNEELVAHYGFCTIDGHKEKIGNFRIEPPGLFRGRGEHPKQGMLKTRVMPEHVIINCSKDSEYPEPPEGHKWKEVRHDPNVTWLASWTENIQNQIKYVMLNPSSKLKGEKDMMKYEKARVLKGKIDKIRADYVESFKSKEMRVRQRAVAMYFIDKLALRAGNEKDEEQA